MTFWCVWSVPKRGAPWPVYTTLSGTRAASIAKWKAVWDRGQVDVDKRWRNYRDQGRVYCAKVRIKEVGNDPCG